MTGTNEKLRALILSALMVFSVFAGTVALSGAAGASSSAANLSVTSAVEYDDGNIEIITQNSQDLTASGISVSVYKDGADVTGDYTLKTTGGNRHVLTSGTDVLPTEELTVTVENTTSGDVLLDNGTVTTTAATLEVDASNVGSLNTRQGGPIALNFSEANQFFEIEDSDGNQVKGVFASGSNSYTFVVDSEDFNTGEEYDVIVDDTGGDDLPETKGGNFTLRPLTLSVSADSTDITDSQALTGTIQSEASRSLDVALLDADGNLVSSTTVSTSGAGEATFDFGTQSPGDYTVQVTDQETSKTASTATISVTAGADINREFVDNTVRVPQGDVAYIDINVSGTTTGALTIGDLEDAGYEANITFTDNGDGQITIGFNTYTAGETAKAGATAFAASEGDSITVEDETQLSQLLAKGDYGLGLAATKDAAANNPDKVGTVFIQDRSTDSIQTWRGDSSLYGNLGSAADVLSAVQNGDLVQSSSFEPGDTLVHQIEASGLEGAFMNGSLLGTEAGVLVEQQDPEINRDPKTIDTLELAAELGNGVEIFHQAGTDSYFIVMDTGQDIFYRNDRTNDIAASSGEAYDVAFSVLGAGSLASSDQTVTTTFNFQTGTSNLDQDDYVLQSDSGQAITGTSTKASGTTVTVRIESQDPNEPFVDRTQATVQSDGTFSAEFDLSDLPQGTNLTVQLFNANGDQIDSATAQIAQPASFEVSNLDAPSTAQIGDTVTVTADVTNTGDVEGTTDVEFVFAGDVISELTQSVTLSGGETQTVTFEIPIGEDVPPGTYEHGVQAGDGSQFAEITIEEAATATPTATPTAEPTTEPPTATPTATPTDEPTTEPPTATPTDEPTTEPPTATPTDEPTTEPMDGTPTATEGEGTGTDTGTPEDGGGGQPGFTMGIGIVALLAAALLALRRRD